MRFWIIIAAMAVSAAALLLLPFLRRRFAAARRDYDIAVYRDQLAEVARDEARGLLSGEEAAAARLEIERRILAADTAQAPAAPVSKRSRAVLAIVAVLAPLAAIALYLDQGAPNLPGRPFAERTPGDAGHELDAAQLRAMVDKLATKLADRPDDLEGWAILGRSYMALERFDEAAAAFATAASLKPDDAAFAASEGEALVLANGGLVTPEARDAFEDALHADAKEPRSRFYLGLASIQAGEPRAALAAWEALAAEGPADAPWLPELKRQIANLRERLADEEKNPPEKPAPENGN